MRTTCPRRSWAGRACPRRWPCRPPPWCHRKWGKVEPPCPLHSRRRHLQRAVPQTPRCPFSRGGTPHMAGQRMPARHAGAVRKNGKAPPGFRQAALTHTRLSALWGRLLRISPQRGCIVAERSAVGKLPGSRCLCVSPVTMEAFNGRSSIVSRCAFSTGG